MARQILPGGVQALESQYESPKKGRQHRRGEGGDAEPDNASPKKKARKGRNQRLQERLKQAESALGRGGGGKGKVGGRGGGGGKGGGGKGKGKGTGKTPLAEQACYSYSKGDFGPCKDAAAGSLCPNGRAHKCHKCGGAHKGKECTQG